MRRESSDVSVLDRMLSSRFVKKLSEIVEVVERGWLMKTGIACE